MVASFHDANQGSWRNLEYIIASACFGWLDIWHPAHVLCLSEHHTDCVLTAHRKGEPRDCCLGPFSKVWVNSEERSAPYCMETLSFSLTPPLQWLTCGSGIRVYVILLPLTGQKKPQCWSWTTLRFLNRPRWWSALTALLCQQKPVWNWPTCRWALERRYWSSSPTQLKDSIHNNETQDIEPGCGWHLFLFSSLILTCRCYSAQSR